MRKNPMLESIEESFTIILAKKGSVDRELKNIAKNLKRLLHDMYNIEYDFDIDFCENIPHKFFGMSVYPSPEAMKQILDGIINNEDSFTEVEQQWAGCTSWTIEIDTELIYNRNLNINPAEATAILLHEIGHVVGTNTVPLRLKKCIRNKLTKLNIKTRKMVELDECRPILFPTVIEACSTKMYKYVGSSEELAADQYAKKLGYGEQLNGFLDKMLRVYGNGLTQTTEKEAQSDINYVLDWSVEAIDEMRYRKNKLNQSLKMQMLATPSKYAKRVMDGIRTSFFSKRALSSYDDRYGVLESSIFSKEYMQNYTERFAEAIERKANEAVLEALFIGKRKLKKIDPLDIDYIEIEIDKIMNHDDKIYVLDLIYYQISLIDKGLEMIDNGDVKYVPDSKRDLERYKENLLRLRSKAANTKIAKKNPLDISIKIDYPKGFEG